jgi:hypothetical protein
MLSLTNARLDDMEHRLACRSLTAPSSPPTQDDNAENEARMALHNILFPEHPLPGHDHHNHQARTTFHTAMPFTTPGEEQPVVAETTGTAGYVPPPQGPPVIHIEPPTANNSNVGGSHSHATPKASAAGSARMSEAPDVQSPCSSNKATPKAASHRSLPRQFAEVGQGDVAPAAHDKPTSFDPLCPPLPYPRPWDVVTQRLFSWALVWMEDDFVRTLETTALGYQVSVMAAPLADIT